MWYIGYYMVYGIKYGNVVVMLQKIVDSGLWMLDLGSQDFINKN